MPVQRWSAVEADFVTGLARSICLTFLTACMWFQPGAIAQTFPLVPVALASPPAPNLGTERGAVKRANFSHERPSHAARQLADWVIQSNDNEGLPFAIVDKVGARVFVFRNDGTIRGAGAALLGAAVGDDTVPGIGSRPMSGIQASERTTPAGRFVASMGHNARGESILWIDYDAAVSMHRVVTSNVQEHRMQRLLSPTRGDKRISYGCINVLPRFFESIVMPAFQGTYGVVYILPEIRPMSEVFPHASSAEMDEGAKAPEMPTRKVG